MRCRVTFYVEIGHDAGYDIRVNVEKLPPFQITVRGVEVTIIPACTPAVRISFGKQSPPPEGDSTAFLGGCLLYLMVSVMLPNLDEISMSDFDSRPSRPYGV